MEPANADGDTPMETTVRLDLSALPPIFVSATHFDSDDLHELEEELSESHAPLTYDLREARIVLSKATRKPRIQFDLRSKGVWTEDMKAAAAVSTDAGEVKPRSSEAERATKRPKLEKPREDVIVIDDSSTASEGEEEAGQPFGQGRNQNKSSSKEKGKAAAPVRTPSPHQPKESDIIRVVRIDWFYECKKRGTVLPLDPYLTFTGRRIPKPPAEPSTPKSGSSATKSPPIKLSTAKSVLERAKEDAPTQSHSHSRTTDRFGKRKFGHFTKPLGIGGSWEAGHNHQPQLLHATTSEAEGSGSSSDLPEPPEWVRKGVKYACQRSTPKDSPNEDFISLLKKIRTARELTNDEIGVRAYSTSIASLAAYPYKLVSPREILRLPGCETKIANLFVEFVNEGSVKAVREIDESGELAILKLFYNIWGVGASTAREFYYDRGWRELDDIVEFGWSTLTRVQQIGVKFYDEFLDLIPRPEVEEIGRIVHAHAVKVRDEGVQSLIVGGYRRGKEASGDVDIIVSHPDEKQTLNIVNDIVTSLEDEGWITHTLLLSLNSTNRGQQTLPFRSGNMHGGHGFDTLDKALVVWQDPSWPTKDADVAADPKAKNPNIHRRVDIIVSTWRTVGCAVTGWSGGTTFQRDLRRYAKNPKGWKFDSSGVRSRVNGEVVDLEGFYHYEGKIGKGRAKTMLEAERRVFEGMGLVFREPEERCTG
jgi:DNA polymerase IV